MVCVGFSFESLQEIVCEDTMAVSPACILKRCFADVAGGDDGTLFLGCKTLQILIDEVIDLGVNPGSGVTESIAVAGICNGQDFLGFQYMVKGILHLPQGKGSATYVIDLGIGGEQIKVSLVARIRRPVGSDVKHNRVLWVRHGDAGRQG